ncbi:MAG TPA: acyl carrier protein [Bacteroidia bacterium]|jgi:acyl carrier protein|nr:acyl carrier protein [Bacteroidia bacterium]
MKEEIFSQLTQVYRDVFSQPDLQIERQMTAKDIRGWDSMSHLTLIVTVEKVFGIRLSGSEVMRLKNVGDLADIIERKKQ